MSYGFKPSPGASAATFRFGSLHCQACADDLVSSVRRMVGIDCLDFELDTAVLRVSYFAPASAESIRKRLADACFAIIDQPELTLVHGEAVPQSLSA